MYQSSRLIIHNDTAYIDPLIHYLGAVAAQLGLNESETHRICYAVEETLSNSILFDFEPGSQEEIEVQIRLVAAGLKVVISDQGMPRNPFAQMPKSLEQIASEVSFDAINQSDADEITSLSSFVIHKLLDRYSTINRGKLGRSVEMTIFASRDRYSEASTIPQSARQLTTGKFSTIRAACQQDSVAISRLFYKSYGYSYVYDLVYYPERLAQALQSQRIQSLVAVSDQQEVIGHIALMKPYENAVITEWGMAISTHGFRGQGIMSRMIEQIMTIPALSDFQGIFAHSVTNHEFTQKICNAHGFSDVALLLGYAPADISFKNIHNKLPQRESTIISYKLLRPIAPCTLFLPQKHKDIIRMLYRNLGVEIKPHNINPGKLVQNSQIKEMLISSVNVAEIVIEEAGNDILAGIMKSTKKFCIAKVDILYLIINLEDATAVAHINAFEKEGYLFAGIFPWYHHKHSLIMQYFNNLKFDFRLINTFSPTAAALKDYVRQMKTV